MMRFETTTVNLLDSTRGLSGRSFELTFQFFLKIGRLLEELSKKCFKKTIPELKPPRVASKKNCPTH